jgi:hypothetical protein
MYLYRVYGPSIEKTVHSEVDYTGQVYKGYAGANGLES